jgi:hypothetical protein
MLSNVLPVGALLPGPAALPKANGVHLTQTQIDSSFSLANAAGHAVRALSEDSLHQYRGIYSRSHMSS